MRLVAIALVALACGRGERKAPDAHADADAGPVGELHEHVVLEEVEVHFAWPADLTPVPTEDEVIEQVTRELTDSPLFADPSDEAPLRMRRRRVRLRVSLGGARGEGVVQGLATFELEWPGDDEALPQRAASMCEIPSDGDEPARRAAGCALSSGAVALLEQEQVRRGSEEELILALSAEDPALRDVAFRAIADRRAVGAVPRLLELLHSEDELVRDGAIGALVALRDPRAIGPITEIAAFKDIALMARVIDAIAAIGGQEAREYLDFVATGHDVGEIRLLAEQALRRLDRKSDAGPD